MARLEELTPGTLARGILAGETVEIIHVHWHAATALEVTFRDGTGRTDNQLLSRSQESSLEVVASDRLWSFNGDGQCFRLASEALRIRLAHLFDPHLAVHISMIEPLPHQITAVYEEMLPRQPLRFLLADDPGAGKTIMAGLLIKELAIRGDLKRCLIVVPGSLAEQWQDELFQKFQLPFDILTNDRIKAARGNVFQEMGLVIARLDKVSRDENLQHMLEDTDWDLVVCDEAHKLSASFFSGEVRETKRYKLGRLVSRLTRHFLLITATPHNGKEEDFQLFMALIDADRFEGRFRGGVHKVDVSDLLHRLTKEELLRFDGTPLFPERRAYTVSYELSSEEAQLYEEVTAYVREEFNRADTLDNEGRKGTVGFALMVLQRRLASSPEAIYQSIKRRRERLEDRLSEECLARHSKQARSTYIPTLQLDSQDDWDDLDECPGDELEQLEDEVVDQASAARTIAELEAEIDILRHLEALALAVRRSARDRKWEELSRLLDTKEEMFDTQGRRRKLVVFTEHRDTLNYLANRIRNLLGRQESVVVIHGAISREERRGAQTAFVQDPEVQVLVANDAAGEGINLQRAHLMVNYDLPWNPNRLEQRFGRIHRIGQTEVCHLWNLVAAGTREGDVYGRLLEKLEAAQQALGGRVFDVLGQAIAGKELRRLLVEAVRYGDRPDVRARLNQQVEGALDRERIREILEEKALARDTIDAAMVQRIREDMERAAARRLQPHFIASFFRAAFAHLGGMLRDREPGRYEITHVPAAIRSRHHTSGIGEPVADRYERICFDKQRINLPHRPPATFVCPGHPLLEATIDLVQERYRHLLRQGAVLIDNADDGETMRCLFYLQHTVRDGRRTAGGEFRAISRRMQFVETTEEGRFLNAGYAPYLDYRAANEVELAALAPYLEQQNWVGHGLESQVISFAVRDLVPEHFKEVSRRREKSVDRTLAAVQERLVKEINHWDYRAAQLQKQEAAGRINARLNSARARQRVNELKVRLKRRTQELEQERQVSSLPPVISGGALVIPRGLLQRLLEQEPEVAATFARHREIVESLGMRAVCQVEERLKFIPRDISADNRGYDIESSVPNTGRLRFIEVKGRIAGGPTVTVSRNEILTALNKPEDFILALVRVPKEAVESVEAHGLDSEPARRAVDQCTVRYVHRPFEQEPDFGVTSVNYNFNTLWKRGKPPA